MNTIDKQLIFFGLLVVRLGSAKPAQEFTVGQLMLDNSSDKSSLVNYFKTLELDKHCTSPILNVSSFIKYYHEADINPVLCTVIYNMTLEIQSRGVIMPDVEALQNLVNSVKEINNVTLYKTWQNITELSPSLKLLMDNLNNVEAWKYNCINFDKVLKPQCTFLSLEVLILYNNMDKTKEFLKKKVVSSTEKIGIQNSSSVKSEDIKKSDVQTLTNVKEPSNEELDEVDTPITKVNIVNEEHTEKVNNNKLMNNYEYTGEDELEKSTDIKEKEDTQIATDTLINSKSSDDYPKEDDGTIVHSEIKEAQTVFGQKNKFPNHKFGNAEDSHFLFYFGIITVLSMLFYLALYKKKKIIALLIEGRRSNNHRRRPNTASYSKVETNDASTVF